MIRHLTLLLALGTAAVTSAQEVPDPKPYQLARSEEFILKSAAGAEYRIMVALPQEPPPPGGHAVTYVLDGDDLFPVLTSLLRLQAGTGKLSKHNGITPGIVVGIGYPAESRRDFDYTLPAPAGPPETYRNGKPYPPRPGGGAEAFLSFLEKDLRPVIEKLHAPDRSRQTLLGNGYGGLLALHVLFTRPELFQTYIASSPSIWWNDRYILQEEKSFTEKLASKPVQATLVMTVGELEQSLTQIEAAWPEEEREEHRLKITRRKMVDNTRELAWRLEALAKSGLETELRIFPGESHKSVVPMAIGHVLPYAFPPVKR
ncbi:alpha/beta hydrolase [Luteolibacter sp. Populi]|uniref:alpha/beta hydrolase n=1 Tax=Luteolibacter sp. Populi TaxID=3230487 RepID=UPI00346766D7